jgi:RNA polymerase sigma-B factor
MDDSRNRGHAPAHIEDHQQRRLLRLWLVHGRHDAREQLYLGLLPLARRVARRHQTADETLEDLIQVASIGLLKAIDRFDLRRSTPLRAYAERMIDGEVRHHLRDATALLHVPRALLQRARVVSGTGAGMTARLGRRPTPVEIADELDLSPAEVTDALQAQRALRLQSLDALDAGSPEDAVSERLGVDDPRYDLVERRAAVEAVWRSLEPRERECLRLRFVEDLTYARIADRLGLSVTHVARLTTRALSRLQIVASAGDEAA